MWQTDAAVLVFQSSTSTDARYCLHWSPIHLRCCFAAASFVVALVFSFSLHTLSIASASIVMHGAGEANDGQGQYPEVNA